MSSPAPTRPELKIHDLAQPLATGVTLIEASAGTGKTYTIAAIFLRLILEHGLRVDQILVTTFTRPATAELRDRIRGLLHEAHEAFRTGVSKNDLLIALLANFADARREKQMLLRDALRGFDEAAIDTIHAFCQRVLTRFGFESGAAADPEFITDETLLLNEVAFDFWRRRYYACVDCVAAAAAQGGLSPGSLAHLLGQWLTQPATRWVPQPEEGAVAKQECAMADALERLRALWPKSQPEVRRLLFEQNKWAKDPFNDPVAMEEALRGADSCLSSPHSPLYTLESLLVFARSAVEKGTRANAAAPAHPFFDACEELLVLIGRYRVAVEGEFLRWAPEELRRRKERANLVSFVDLLTRLETELKSARGEALRERIRAQFPAALIDEFQDTDPLQDAIFERVFGAPGWLFLIGDPKQAIFGFRGADVFTYLAASKRAERPLTLGTNYRSTTPLVRATNAIFSSGARPFVDGRIRFEPAKSAGREDGATFAGAGPAAPLRLWVANDNSESQKASVCDALTAATAGEIARLLAPGGGQIGDRPVLPSDIAVLTGSNAAAAEMQEALRALGVPSALLSTSSVFNSREAREMSTLLHAVSRPQDERRLRAALLTDLLGQNVLDLHALAQDAGGWEKWSARFHEWHETWRHSGFVAMFRRVLRETQARPRLLARPDGERRLTNLLHLAELVQCAATDEQLAPAALVKWLAARLAEPPARQDAYELRLERDDEAVRLVTVHKSKGLEYNIVFCPFAWEPCRDATGPRLRFHDDADKPVLDLGSDDLARHRPRAFQEQLAEDVRLLYVALTRARHRCDVALAHLDKHLVSAASWLLQDAPPADTLAAPPGDNLHGALKTHFKAIGATRWRVNLEAVAARAEGAIAVVEIPSPEAPRFVAPAGKKRRPARRFKGEIERDFTISSFSSLTSETSADAPERFAPPWSEAEERGPAGEDLHAFPAGARTGVCLHEIFERLDFTDLSNADGMIAGRLMASGFDAARWTDVVSQGVRRVLQTTLPSGFRLDQIAPGERLVEREFHLPVRRLEAEKLVQLSGLDPENRLQFSPRTGWLKGFIDLVFRYDGRFYLVDWKSNRLGPNGAAYSQENIAASMASHHYALQAQLYAVALHRYLRQRVAGYEYEKHFGSLSYLFVRGLDPAVPGQGVWHHRPDADAIATLDEWLT